MRSRLQLLLLALAAASAPALAQDSGQRPDMPLDLAPAPSPEQPKPARVPHDPGRTHYFFGSSAYTLRAGEHSISQQELLYSAYEYGATNEISIELGSVVPAWLSPTYLNFAFGAKLGLEITEGVRGALVGEVMLLPLGPSVPKGPLAVALGVVTMGGPDAHFSFAVGNTWGFQISGQPFTPVVMASGLYRVHPNVALVTDNVLMPFVNGSAFSTSPIVMANSGGVRLMTDLLAADLGLMYWPAAGFPIPWASVTATFGG